jgi:hypothetical protein
LAASLPLYVFVTLGGLRWLDPALPKGDYSHVIAFTGGYILAVVVQVVGVVAGIIWWQAAKR